MGIARMASTDIGTNAYNRNTVFCKNGSAANRSRNVRPEVQLSVCIGTFKLTAVA